MWRRGVGDGGDDGSVRQDHMGSRCVNSKKYLSAGKWMQCFFFHSLDFFKWCT